MKYVIKNVDTGEYWGLGWAWTKKKIKAIPYDEKAINIRISRLREQYPNVSFVKERIK